MSAEYFEYKGLHLPTTFYSQETMSFAENDFKVLDDDVFIVTYAKSGTAWMIEILSLIRHNGDPTWCKTVPNYERAPWFATKVGQAKMTSLKSPRLLTSHLPRWLFPKSFSHSNAKVIYTLRNPKDVMVSMYYYYKTISGVKDQGSFEECYSNFLQGPFFPISWFDHVKGWMEIKDQKNFFFITYEELSQDLRGSVIRICEFLGKELDSAAIDSIVENASFKSMKENKMANFTFLSEEAADFKSTCFMRKGICGDWKNHFTVAQNEEFDNIYLERMKDMKVKFLWDKN